MAGLDLAAPAKKARRITKDFKPVSLAGAAASFKIENTLRKIDSNNVIAKLEGSDPALKDQYVVYTAHWDHLGRDPESKGDQIYNGAADNVVRQRGLLEIARAYTKLSPAPRRSILFLSVTAEEQGLLGTQYYAENPLYPLKNTLADINMDGLNTWGKTKDITIIGLGNSDARRHSHRGSQAGRTTEPWQAIPNRRKGSSIVPITSSLPSQGVPALDPDSGTNYIGKPADYGKQKRDNYTANDYHKPSDEVKPDWDLSGAVDDLRVFLEIGYRVAQASNFPEWKPGTEFKAKRDAMVEIKQQQNNILESCQWLFTAIFSITAGFGIPAEASLFPGQLGLLAGWRRFQYSARGRWGIIPPGERHWARMLRDARLLNVEMPSDSHALERDLLRLIDANGVLHCTLRVVVVRNGGGLWEGPASGRASDTIALTANSKQWGESVRLGVQPHARYAAGEFTGAKMLSWAANLRWAERAQAEGFDEVILLNEMGRVAECTSATTCVRGRRRSGG